MKLLKEINESQEKAAERDARKAERELEKARVEKEMEIEKAKVERDIKMRELEIKEIELNTASAKDKSKIKPKVVLPKFSEGNDIEVF